MLTKKRGKMQLINLSFRIFIILFVISCSSFKSNHTKEPKIKGFINIEEKTKKENLFEIWNVNDTILYDIFISYTLPKNFDYLSTRKIQTDVFFLWINCKEFKHYESTIFGIEVKNCFGIKTSCFDEKDFNKMIDEHFNFFDNLSELVIESDLISNIPESVYKLKNLKKLTIANPRKSIHIDFAKLSNLTNLNYFRTMNLTKESLCNFSKNTTIQKLEIKTSSDAVFKKYKILSLGQTIILDPNCFSCP